MKFYEVGGAVRDSLLGLTSKDIDYAVELSPEELALHPSLTGFEIMVFGLREMGFGLFLETPEFLTVRAKFPRGHKHAGLTADFVLCRKDSPTGDGRRPDGVEMGTILDDLARRDFTVNAIARCEDGTLLDPHDGQGDLQARILRFVGDPMTRIREDGLRVLRALRFSVTKGLNPDGDMWLALHSDEAAEMLLWVSVERIREELEKMLVHDTKSTLFLLSGLPKIQWAIFRDGLRFSATLKR